MKIGVVTFPGSLDDGDAARAARIAGAQAVRLWHADPDLHGVDAVVLPGGFSYGDYLRCGAIARFAPVMETIKKAAADGLPVLGICNGFQILCEAHLLPGALTRNQHLHFRNRDQWLRFDSVASAWTGSFVEGQEILIPVKNGEGCFVADADTLDQLEANGQIVARYINGNPNGSMRDIAAVRNEAGNVLGIMPHPEHAVEALTGPSLDGLGFFVSILRYLAAPAVPSRGAAPLGSREAAPLGEPAVPEPAIRPVVPVAAPVPPAVPEPSIRPIIPIEPDFALAPPVRPEIPSSVEAAETAETAEAGDADDAPPAWPEIPTRVPGPQDESQEAQA